MFSGNQRETANDRSNSIALALKHIETQGMPMTAGLTSISPQTEANDPASLGDTCDQHFGNYKRNDLKTFQANETSTDLISNS